MQRGEVWWARLGPPSGTRPVLLVSRNEAYDRRAFALVAPVTTRIRGIPAEVAISPDDGMPSLSVANLDSLETIPLTTLQRRITVLKEDKLAEVDETLHFTLGLSF